MRIPFSDFFPASVKPVLAVDIGDSQAKYLLARREQDTWNILRAGERETDLLSWDRTLEGILKEAKGSPGALVCSLPQSEFRAFIHRHEAQRKDETPVSAAEARVLDGQARTDAEAEAIRFCTGVWTVSESDIAVPLSEIVHREANGYPVSRIERLQASHILLRTFSVCALRDSLQRLEQVRKKFRIPQAAVRHSIQGTGMLLAGRKEDALYVEIGGQSTQLCMIRQGKPEWFFQFKGGGGSATSAIERELGVGRNSARDMKERYARGEFSEDTRSKLRELLLSAAQKWSTLCVEYLSQQALLLPPRIVFTGGASLLPEFPEALASRIRELAVTGEPATAILLPDAFIPSKAIPSDPTFTPVTSLLYGYSPQS